MAAQIIHTLQMVRGLRESPVAHVEFADDDALGAAFWKSATEQRSLSVQQFLSSWHAFGIVARRIGPPKKKRFAPSMLLGLYDFDSKTIYLRKRAQASTLPTDVETLAHEAEHSMQHETFQIRLPDKPDELVAAKSVYEGDAVATSLALFAYVSGKSADTFFQSTNVEAFHLAEEQGKILSGHDTAASSDEALTDFLLFPYKAGFKFVRYLYGSAGFLAVNNALENPPTTTEQVLHPEKWYSKELGIAVRLPVDQADHVLSSGTFGEFGLSLVLRGCGNSKEEAAASTVGWGGDTYALLQPGSGGANAVTLSTVWDDEASAARFAQALSKRVGCWNSAPATQGVTRVLRRNRAVILVRTQEVETTYRKVVQLIESAVADADSAPTVTPEPAKPKHASPFGDLARTVPTGFKVENDNDNAFEMIREQPFTAAVVAMTRGNRPDYDAEWTWFKRLLPKGEQWKRRKIVPSLKIAVPWSGATQATFAADDAPTSVIIVNVPACSKGTVLIILLMNQASRPEMESWLANLARLRGTDSCY
jgi:hypothetical protein